MRRMKSRLVRVKVWYEHAPGIDIAAQAVGVERELMHAIQRGRRKGQSSDVEMHDVEVGEKPIATSLKRPEPDF